MNTRLVLDTSAVLAFFNGSDPIRAWLNSAEVVYLPSICIGELYFGALKCSRPDQENRKIETMILRTKALNVDYSTAKIYASVIHGLESEGKRIPLNDIWIASLALQHNCSLIAIDAHFSRIEGLDIISL